MTRDEMIEMATQAGLIVYIFDGWVDDWVDGDILCLARFAELIAAQEREACAKRVSGYPDCADAIRARSTKREDA